MATAPPSKPGFKFSLADMDAPTKKKAILALSVLFLAVVWLIIWFGVLSGGSSKPAKLSAEKEAQLMEDHNAEQQKIEEAARKLQAKTGRPPPPPKGS